ncbi:hypothetical protein BJY00DRAFT_317606 [Aspergillus carlsbadensis]|nr:hypothetical protein BJY00DRAFT_317606 [Aspergillus carlsbadensis]
MEASSKSVYSNQLPLDTNRGSGKTLRKPAGSIVALVFEMFLCLVALCFIALALIALSIKGRPTGDTLGDAMEQAMTLGPTIYPILFAALLSRSLKSIGRYCAQRSVGMATLWALMNTNATADPLLHLVSMPASILVWTLLVLWAMSPLGGQSAIRLMYKTNATDITHSELRYWDNGPLGNMFVWQGINVNNDGSWPLSMRDIFSASLMQSTSIKTGARDQWGNIKIPRLEAGDTSQIDSNGWMPFRKASNSESFTSLFGVPIVGLEEIAGKGDVNFTIETAYVELSPASMSLRDILDDQAQGMTVDCVDCFRDGSNEGFDIRAQRFLGLPIPPRIKTDPNSLNYTTPRTVRFNSSTNFDTTVATCHLGQRMVEAFIECVNQECAATKIRESVTDRRDKNGTSFDYWAWTALDLFSSASSKPISRDVIYGSVAAALFLNDSTTFPIQSGINSVELQRANLSLVDPNLFARRGAVLLSTALQAMMAPLAFAGGLPTNNLSLYGPPHIPGYGPATVANETAYREQIYSARSPPPAVYRAVWEMAPFLGAATNATLAQYTEVYKPAYVWVIILIVSSVLLFAVGVAGIAVRFKTLAPNVFDPVVGLTYGNQYMSLTGRDDDPIDADERAMILREKRVQLGEVDDYKGVKVVFGEAGYVTPLRQGVPYHAS